MPGLVNSFSDGEDTCLAPPEVQAENETNVNSTTKTIRPNPEFQSIKGFLNNVELLLTKGLNWDWLKRINIGLTPG